MSFLSEERTNFNFKAIAAGIFGTGNRNTAPDSFSWFEEICTIDAIIKPQQVWGDYGLIPPAKDYTTARANTIALPAVIKEYDTTSPIHMTPWLNNKAFFATSTYGDLSSRLSNFIMPQLIPRTDAGYHGFPSIGYMVRVYQGHPNFGGIEIATSQDQQGAVSGWIFSFGAGALLFASSFSAITDPTDIWITGFQYIGGFSITPERPIIEFLTVINTNILSDLSVLPVSPTKTVLNINGVDAYYGASHDFTLSGLTITINPFNLQYNIEVGDIVVCKYYI